MTTYYEAGRHYVDLGEVFFGESQQKKTPFIGIYFTPKNGQYQRDVKLWLTDKTVSRVVAILRSFGWKGSRFSDIQPSQFEGVQTELDCAHNDDGYEQWEFPPPERSAEPSDPKIARKLDALFGKELANAAPQPSEPVAVPEDIGKVGEDDIPF